MAITQICSTAPTAYCCRWWELRRSRSKTGSPARGCRAQKAFGNAGYLQTARQPHRSKRLAASSKKLQRHTHSQRENSKQSNRSPANSRQANDIRKSGRKQRFRRPMPRPHRNKNRSKSRAREPSINAKARIGASGLRFRNLMDRKMQRTQHLVESSG
jgi:hypothetical protein